MPIFTYTAADINGKTVHGRETAEDKNALFEKLKGKNLYCMEFSQLEEKQQDAKCKFKTKDLAFLSRQLSAMLTSGISLVRALGILAEQQPNPKQRLLLSEVYDDVQRGKSFSEAIAAQHSAFPNLFISMVAAGESSGSLDTIMERVSRHYDKENKTNNKIRSAMIYPIVLGVIMFVIVIALFVVVMPQFTSMFTNPDDIPIFTQILMAISNSMINYWFLYIGAGVGIVLMMKMIFKVPSVRLWFDKLKIKIPKAGPLLCTIYTSRFAHTMSNLFASGLQMVECIEKSVQVLDNAYISKEFEGVIEKIKQGETLSASVGKTGIFDGIFTSIIYVGEESGKLDDILEKTADYYDEEADTAISKLVALLQPVMIVVMGVIVCVMLIGIYPALYGSMNNIA